jgi:ABC-2 type transport system ATP-binding protein
LSSPLIQVEDISKNFSGRTVIDDFSFTIGSGEVVGLLGPNGSGKTTMIRLLNGLLRPDAGSIRVMGLEPVREGHAVRQASGVLTESADFYSHLSGLDNLRFFAALYQVHDPARPGELLQTFGLADDGHKPVGTYSTGMRKRLGLAKALLHRPEILFLDEPTNGLDPQGTRLVLSYIRELNEQQDTTILICSHLLQQLELVCHRYLFIDHGRLIEQGTLPELKVKYQQHVELEVITDLEFSADATCYRGVPVSVVDSPATAAFSVRTGAEGAERRLRFKLQTRDEVPGFLQQLVGDARIYGAAVIEQDLESLYFRIHGEVRS